VNMDSYAAPFPPLAAGSMRVPIAGAMSSAQGDDMVLMILGAVFDLGRADLVFAYADDCAWPCMHAADSGEALDVLGASLPAPGQTGPSAKGPPASACSQMKPALVLPAVVLLLFAMCL